MLINNHILKFIASQQISQQTQDFYFAILNNLSEKQTDITDYLLGSLNYWVVGVCPAQQTMADSADAQRITAWRTTNELNELGIITKEYRHRKTSIYDFHPIFYNLNFRERLKHKYRAFAYIPTFLLLAGNGQLASFVTPNKEHANVISSSQSKVTNQFLNSIYNCKRRGMSSLKQQLISEFNLDNRNQDEISGFADGVLKTAGDATRKKQGLSKPQAYFMTIARKEQANYLTQKAARSQPQVLKTEPYTTYKSKPQPEEENPDDAIAKIEAHMETPEGQAAAKWMPGIFVKELEKWKEKRKQMGKIEKIEHEIMESIKTNPYPNPPKPPIKSDNLEDIRNKYESLIKYRDNEHWEFRNHPDVEKLLQKYNQILFGSQFDLPQENKIQQSKTQEIKKDSTTVKFDVNFNEVNVDDQDQFEEVYE